MSSDTTQSRMNTMRMTLFISVILMAIKFFAYYITSSNAILTDALESIINVIAGIFALISTYYATLPRDENHPYGHGKIEFLSAGFEGALIFIAGLSITIKAIYGFFNPNEINEIDNGIYLCAIAGTVNYLMGLYLVRKGKKYNSILMKADGKHLISDTVSSIGLIAGLAIIYFTRLFWLDNVLSIIFGLFIFQTGYKLVRESVTSLLDEADYEKIQQLITVLNNNRREKWIDMHNLRVQKFGPQLHVDCHMTLPWYDTLELSHIEVDAVEKIVKEKLNGNIEFFIHADPCLPSSCPICVVQNCKVRQHAFVKRLDWTLENILPDHKHRLQTPEEKSN